MMREDFLNIMDKCGVIDLYDDGDAYVSSGNIGDWVECMRAVEQATLERAAKNFEERDQFQLSNGRYIAKTLRALKDSHD